MPNDDPSLESATGAPNSVRTTRAPSSDETIDQEYRDHLESLDVAARRLSAAVEADDEVDEATQSDVTRRLRAVRTELATVRLALSSGVFERPRPARIDPITDNGVPMVVRRGPVATTCLGPDLIAFERACEERE